MNPQVFERIANSMWLDDGAEYSVMREAVRASTLLGPDWPAVRNASTEQEAAR